ncbi:hypothetical protein [Microbacterium sp. A84]|uniref:hypothetical protein n=1 Tax=Microbacterium sp. A84 TaxID=3450715 RepID=UPI003F42E6B9
MYVFAADVQDVTEFNRLAPIALTPHASGSYRVFAPHFKSSGATLGLLSGRVHSPEHPFADMAAAVSPAVELLSDAHSNPLEGIALGSKIIALVVAGYAVHIVQGRYLGLRGGQYLLRPGRTRGAQDMCIANDRERRVLWAQKDGTMEDALAIWADVVGRCPQVHIYDADDAAPMMAGIPAPTESGVMARAAFVLNHPGFGEGPSRGALFFATGHDVDDGVVYGHYWAPDDNTFTEMGAFEVEQLHSLGARVRGFVPVRRPWAVWTSHTSRADGYALLAEHCTE